MKRRVFNKAGYVIRIGGQFTILPGRGAIIPEEFSKDPAIDRYIKVGVLEGELLGDEKPKAAPAPKKEEPKAVEPAPEPKAEEPAAEEAPAEEAPKPKSRKSGKKAKAE